MPLTVFQVFTPNDQPTITYVERGEAKLEQQFRDAIARPKAVISLSGPSKSGKSVLFRKVVDDDLTIKVSGAAIQNTEDFWTSVLSWMDVPATKVTTTQNTVGAAGESSLSGSMGLKGIAKGGLTASLEITGQRSTSVASSGHENILQQVVTEIGGSDFVVFLDDFHYIARNLQPEIAKNIKAAAEAGVRICTASVPHRSDDVVRANPELRGRISAIDFSVWSPEDLKEIARLGFAAMNLGVSPSTIERLAIESIGSPQLMQSLCLNLCLELSVREKLNSPTSYDISSKTLTSVLERTSLQTDFSSLVDSLHSGPRQRGTERKVFHFSDGTSGDVYRAILLAIRNDPLSLSLGYEDLLSKVRKTCRGESPIGSSVVEALKQMEKISGTMSANFPVLEWDEDVLDIVEPYFLFYLRCSPKLAQIASAR